MLLILLDNGFSCIKLALVNLTASSLLCCPACLHEHIKSFSFGPPHIDEGKRALLLTLARLHIRLSAHENDGDIDGDDEAGSDDDDYEEEDAILG
eukprot:scaffold212865_cov48-Prasinocladus_malaysianus.AAC.1